MFYFIFQRSTLQKPSNGSQGNMISFSCLGKILDQAIDINGLSKFNAGSLDRFIFDI